MDQSARKHRTFSSGRISRLSSDGQGLEGYHVYILFLALYRKRAVFCRAQYRYRRSVTEYFRRYSRRSRLSHNPPNIVCAKNNGEQIVFNRKTPPKTVSSGAKFYRTRYRKNPTASVFDFSAGDEVHRQPYRKSDRRGTEPSEPEIGKRQIFACYLSDHGAVYDSYIRIERHKPVVYGG